jgi:hypothetical protein
MKKILFSLALFFPVLLCFAQSPSYSVRKGGHCYTLDMPDYLTRTFSLNDVATLQYQNTAKSTYVIVIEDSKEQLQEVGMKFVHARDFLESFSSDFKKDMQNRKLSPTTEFKSNGYAHAQTELQWTEDGNEFYMLITGLETPGYFYKILCWTPQVNKASVQADFQRISRSLKE